MTRYRWKDEKDASPPNRCNKGKDFHIHKNLDAWCQFRPKLATFTSKYTNNPSAYCKNLVT